MPLTESDLNAALDRIHVIPVVISADAPLPLGNASYDPLCDLVLSGGLEITTRELLHAIGSKTAALPSSAQDDCLRASLLYTYILDLALPNLAFKPGMDSDLQTPRSQEIGIGMMCLLASKAFKIPWDQLGALPGPGLRFDYRGQVNGFDGIFESKGTSHRSNQASQLNHGLSKKEAHHERGDHFDVELIVSTFVGRGDQQPRILIGDPEFDDFVKLYDQADNRFFRLRHYSRVLQFIGLPKSAFKLNQHAKAHLKGERIVSDTILGEKELNGYLDVERFGNHRYFGRWFQSVLPESSARYSEKRYGEESLIRFNVGMKPMVFQGIREDVYYAGFEGEPFSQDLLSLNDIRAEKEQINTPVSIFPDGTIQVFKDARAGHSKSSRRAKGARS